jgi:general secretion pathway protein K
MSLRQACERGFALLIVLWTLALVALLVTRVLAAGRSELRLAGNLQAGAATEAVADGAVYEATFRLMAGQWRADGLPRRLSIGPGLAELRIADLAGRLNPNMAPLAVMRQLLIGVGAAPAEAAAIAAAMEDWRTPGEEPLPLGAKAAQYLAARRAYVPTGQPFRSLEEIGLVLGMTPALLAALAPHVSVFQEGDPDRRLTDPVVAAALAAEDQPPAASPGGRDEQQGALVVEIMARTLAPAGARFTRRAVVRFAAVTRSNPSPWRILAWEAPAE